MNCQSCGMPMDQDVDHGGGRADNNYCKHCTDEAGNLKSRDEVREGMISFYTQSMGRSREEAVREVDAHMAQMPAWGQAKPAVMATPTPTPIPTVLENPMPPVSAEATPYPMPEPVAEPSIMPVAETPPTETPMPPQTPGQVPGSNRTE
ncbi:MAG: zinc ribbon domain-containing protein [bacterium]|nr:zinc ribbon domain-containing protein [bacterium]